MGLHLLYFVLCFFSADSPVLTSRVAVTVHVLDINEFPPELASPYETFVCENAKVGQVRSNLPSLTPLLLKCVMLTCVKRVFAPG